MAKVLALGMVRAAIGCYAMSLASVTWVVISEIFSNHIPIAAMSVAVSALRIACFILTFLFPILNTGLGRIDSPFKELLVKIAPFLKTGLDTSGIFWLYAAICLAGFIYIKFKLPETKGKTLEQIEKDLVD
jgi:MFS transporter, SP family, arabinose:H+ symporter